MAPGLAFAGEGDNAASGVPQPKLQLTVQSDEGLSLHNQEAYELAYSYNTSQKTATVTGLASGSAASGNLVIPATVTSGGQNYTVTSIAANAFKNETGFTGNLVLPSTLKAVGASAFEGCSELTGAWSLPAGLTSLGSYAFSGCLGISGTVTIPAGVTAIGDHCFYMPGNSRPGFKYGVTGIAFAQGSQLKTIGDYAFAENWKVTGGINIPDSVETIGDYAFYATYRRQGSTTGDDEPFGAQGPLHLPQSLKTIGEGAFGVCSFSGGLAIPNSVTSLGDRAFYEAGFVGGALTLPNGLTAIGEQCFVNDEFIGSLTLPSGITSIGQQAFSGCNYFDSTLAIPANVTEIGDYAFSGFGSEGAPGTLSLPDGLKTIGTGAFSDASHFIGTLSIPDSVEAIGGRAFSLASGFNALKLPANEKYTKIEEKTFGCSAYYDEMGFTGTLVIPDNITEIGDYAFGRCRGLTGTLNLPSSLQTIGENAFEWCDGLTGLVISDSVTSIGENAFFGCEAVSGDVVIPGSVETIESGAFGQFGSKGAQTGTLTIQEGVKTIEDNAFANCSNFVGTISIPSTVTTLGRSVFANCSGFTGFSLPEGMTSIPEGLFSSCRGLTGELVLPESVTSIGRSAFAYCTGLTGDIVIPDGVTSIESSVFSGCTGFDGTLTIPDSVTKIGSSAFNDCNGLTGALVIPQNVTRIDYEAFKGCAGFEGTLVIPASVTTLGSSVFSGCAGIEALDMQQNCSTLPDYLFYGCTGLTGDMAIPSTVTKLGDSIFYGCTGLTGKLTIPDSVTGRAYYSDKPFYNTFFGTIENNSSLTFSADEVSAALNVSYGEDGVIGTGTYTRTVGDLVDIGSATISPISDREYYIYGVEPGLTVKLGGKTLSKGMHYTVEYSGNDRVGVATATITGVGTGGCTGTNSVTFNIIPRGITPTVILSEYYFDYDGTEKRPSVTVKDGNNVLDPATDYDFEYRNNINPGYASVAVVLKGNYTIYNAQEKVVNFGIRGDQIIEASDKTVQAGQTVALDAVASGWLSYKSSDASVATVDSRGVVTGVKAGTATITITADATDVCTAATKTVTVTVTAAPTPTPTPTPQLQSIAGAAVTVAAQTYTGKALTPAPKVVLGGKTLTKGTHYTVAYSNNTNAGTATVTVKGIEGAGYTGSKSASFTIAPASATPAVTLSKASFAYSGKEQKPTVTVKVNGIVQPASAYAVAWPTGCKNVGIYKVAVTLKGNYAGTADASYKIVPKKTSIAKVTPVRKGFTAKWKKQAKQTTGYQVQYSLKKNFKKAKTVTVKGAKKTSQKITKLKAKKKYYVRVRTYKTIGKTKYYSAWSKAKYVTTKK